jgi:hypothetical protein
MICTRDVYCILGICSRPLPLRRRISDDVNWRKILNGERRKMRKCESKGGGWKDKGKIEVQR